MLRIEPCHALFGAEYFFGMDEHVRCLPLETAGRLVDQDVGVGQCGAFAPFACHASSAALCNRLGVADTDWTYTVCVDPKTPGRKSATK